MKRMLRARGRKGKKTTTGTKFCWAPLQSSKADSTSPRHAEWVTREGGQPFRHGFRHVTHLIAKTSSLPFTTLCTFMLFADADLLQGTALSRSLIRENQGHGHVRWRPAAEAIAAVHTGHTTSPGTSVLLTCTLPHAEGGTRSSAIKTKAADRAYDAVFPAAKGLLPSAPPGSPLPLLLFAS